MKCLKDAINHWQAVAHKHNQARVQKNPQEPDEECLFRAFVDYFSHQHYATVVDTSVTHKHLVSYQPIAPYTAWPNPVRKEISDVFVVAFSIKRNLARMTHLQAKLERQNGLNTSTNNFVFELDDGQYLMLHNRLQVHDKSGDFPDDILSCPLYSDSIASYGVFYHDGTEYNMAYELAPLISYFGNTPYADKDAKDNHIFATTQNLWGYTNIKSPTIPFYYAYPWLDHCELLSSVNINTFERELLSLRVGTKVDFDIRMLQKIEAFFRKKKADLKDFDVFVSQQIKQIKDGPLFRYVEEIHDNGFDNVPPQINEYENVEEENGRVFLLINFDLINNRE